MSLSDDQWEFLQQVAKLVLWAKDQGYKLTVADWYPSRAKHKPGGKHPVGLAVDLNLFVDSEYQKTTEAHAKMGAFWESLHPMCTWGGRWNDGNHYSWGEGKR